MKWNPGHHWNTHLWLPSGFYVEYKYFISNDNLTHTPKWEDNPNRILFVENEE